MEKTAIQTPFIKKFKTRNYHCIYDVNSHQFLRVDPVIYDIIDEIGDNGKDNGVEHIVDRFKDRHNSADIRRGYELIRQMQREKDIFSPHKPDITSGITCVEQVQHMLRSGLGQLILETTERCNLRCKYCVFSGRYEHARAHGKCDMTMDTAKKAVDFFSARSKDSADDMPAITFYGGEPLLRFDFIKQVIEYARARMKSRDVLFSFTTNGTLLGTQEVREFLVRNNIHITVSLDGPEDIHDRYRVFANGRGAFARVLNNLEQLKRYNPEYFTRRVSINAVIAPPYDFESMIDFFYKGPLFAGMEGHINFSAVDPYETTFFQDFHLKEHAKNDRKEMDKLLMRYQQAMIAGIYQRLTMEKQLFLKHFHQISYRKMNRLDRWFPPAGTCMPGQRRLFVDTKGKFFMCERVGSNYEIGAVEQGFDYRKIYHFFEEYDRFFADCKYCWALRLCNKCFNVVRKGDKLDKQRKETFCRDTLARLEKYLVVFSEITEQNPDAFKVYEDVTVA